MHRYSKQGLWSLFLVCAFPLHLWTLILVFRDLDWAIKRTNIWDAIGMGAYGMVFAFFESLVVFAVMALLGFATPARWDVQRRITFMSLLVLIVSLWAMFGQLRFIAELSLPLPVLRFMAASSHPFRILYAIYLAFVVPSVVLPVYLFIRSSKSVQWMQDLMDRLSTLTALYLVFDVIGLVIIIIRNVA